MPKLKQPTSLEAIAMKALVEVSVRCCDQISAEGTLQMLCEGISVIKEDVCNCIPWCFLPKFSNKLRPKPHLQAASEILLDMEFVGLRCNGEMLRHLNPRHLHCLRGLVELDFGSVQISVTALKNLRLNDITTLKLYGRTYIRDLKVIGRNCLKLRVLKLNYLNITDKGLRALNTCSDLRVVHISYCQRITDIGVNLLISAHDKLEELYYCNPTDAYGTQPGGFLFLSNLNRPCLVMNRLDVGTNELTNANLRSIVSMFPNLTHFGTSCKSVGDISILKSMSKLEVISIMFNTSRSDPNIDRAWQSLRELLTLVGENIKTLKFGHLRTPAHIVFITEQTGLDFIFHNCPNIEHLNFDHGDYDLVIPPFKKLKTLKLKTSRINFIDGDAINLSNIGEMLNLEVLALENFEVRFRTIKAIVLDHVKFPKLIRIESCVVPKVREIEAIARNNNLDFEIYFCYKPLPSL